MQHLRDRGWVKATQLVGGPSLLRRLLEKGWIESAGTGKDLAYRITDDGMAAKRAPIRLERPVRGGRVGVNAANTPTVNCTLNAEPFQGG